MICASSHYALNMENKELSEEHWKDPYTLSQKLRRKFREEKKERVEEEAKLQGIQDRNALSIPLLPISKEDDVRAKLIEYGTSSPTNCPFLLKMTTYFE